MYKVSELVILDLLVKCVCVCGCVFLQFKPDTSDVTDQKSLGLDHIVLFCFCHGVNHFLDQPKKGGDKCNLLSIYDKNTTARHFWF